MPGVGGVAGAERKLAAWLSEEVLGVRPRLPRLPGMLTGVKAGDQPRLLTGLSFSGVMLSRVQGEKGRENLSGLNRKLWRLVTGEEVEERSEVLSGRAASSLLAQVERKGLWGGSCPLS